MPVVVGLGEVLWDVYPDAARFGGAPANFACHVAALGGTAYVVSAVGDDTLGQRAKNELDSKGVNTEFLQVDCNRDTGTVQVSLDELGVATYAFANDTAWDHLQWTDSLWSLARDCDAVCFGTLGQRSEPSKETVQRFVRTTRKDCLRVLDINLRQSFYTAQILEDSMRMASVVKLNDQELAVVCEILGITYADEQDAMRQISDLYAVPVVAVTRGAQGSAIRLPGTFDQVSPKFVDVVDTVGAGDAFTAALVLGLLRKLPIRSVHEQASKIASFVCTQRGATPCLPQELVNETLIC
jgi:fructokinase